MGVHGAGAGATLVLHGGLFRAPLQLGRAPARKRRKMARGPLTVGKLEDLAGAFKGGPDPSGRGKTVIAADATWSDPVLEPGIHINTVRGVGLVFGPDITQVCPQVSGRMHCAVGHTLVQLIASWAAVGVLIGQGPCDCMVWAPCLEFVGEQQVLRKAWSRLDMMSGSLSLLARFPFDPQLPLDRPSWKRMACS